MRSHSRRTLQGLALGLAGAGLVPACGRPCPRAGPTDEARADGPPAFANKVWKVGRSSGVEPGTLYAFLSDGTLLIASSHGTPALGRWTYRRDTVTLIEEGIPHPAAVLKLENDELAIRLSPGGTPLEITFVPGDSAP